ncbi:MAG: pilus assembly protein [Vampirovibrionales bacterium]|nr:pilus assembly protein [Vampirovibrionales bacterium]
MKHSNRHGQTLIEFALAVPVLVAVFTIMFTLGYATYRAHSAATTLRSLDQNLEVMANKDDPTAIVEEALADFDEISAYGPLTGFGMIRGKYLIDLKWIPGLPSMNVVAFTILPGAVLASNTDSSAASKTYTAGTVGDVIFPEEGSPREWSNFKNTMPTCMALSANTPPIPPEHCVDIPSTTADLMAPIFPKDPIFPKALVFKDNCDTDLGPFIATTGTGSDEHDVVPNDCFAGPATATACHADKLTHAAAYVTQFVLPVDKNGGCAAGSGALLLLSRDEYPPFSEGGAY